MLQSTYRIPSLPPVAEIETLPVLRASALAHRHLAELKGRAISVPNPEILIDTLTLQEARASCEIENIVTTRDHLYQADLLPDSLRDPAAKEVARYRSAVKRGFSQLLGERKSPDEQAPYRNLPPGESPRRWISCQAGDGDHEHVHRGNCSRAAPRSNRGGGQDGRTRAICQR